MKAELKEKLAAAKNGAEIRALIQKYSDELSDEDLENIAGGCGEPCDKNCCQARNENLNAIY